MSDGAVLSVGRLYCDLLFTGLPRLPLFGTELFAEGLTLQAGGGVFITAAHLAGLGRRSAMAAIYPAAPFEAQVRADVAAAGIEDHLSQGPAPGVEPQITVAMIGAKDRAFLSRRAGPPFPDLTQADLAGFSHLHISELGTLIERPDIIPLARAAGMTISLDCGWDDAIDAAVAAPLIARVDVFLPNQDEAARLMSLGLVAPFAPLTITKCGADGAEAQHGTEHLRAPAQAVTVVDTTGAGDAFNAGFLDAWLGKASVADALAAGNARGAQAVTRVGGFGG